MSDETYILIAVVAGAFGVKGEVKIKSFTAELEDCLSYGPLLDQTGAVVLTPVKGRAVKKAMAVICEQVSTPEQADSLKGTELYVPRNAMPDTDEDDFYYSDLIGLQVKTVDGKTAGQVVAVHEFGGGDMLEIKPKEGKSWYHPFTKEAVPKVDIAKGRVIIRLLEIIDAKPPNDYDPDAGHAEPDAQ